MREWSYRVRSRTGGRGFDSPQLHDALHGQLPGHLAGVEAQQGDPFDGVGSLTRGFVGVTDGGIPPPSTEVVPTSLQLSDGGDQIWCAGAENGRMPTWIVRTEHCSGPESHIWPRATGECVRVSCDELAESFGDHADGRLAGGDGDDEVVDVVVTGS